MSQLNTHRTRDKKKGIVILIFFVFHFHKCRKVAIEMCTQRSTLRTVCLAYAYILTPLENVPHSLHLLFCCPFMSQSSRLKCCLQWQLCFCL